MDHHLNGGPPGFAHELFPALGAVMFFLFLLLLVGSFLFLQRGRLGPPPWIAARHSPEGEAKKILAERFARGDIGSDEFMERASILNWTPGSETVDHWHPKKGRRRGGR